MIIARTPFRVSFAGGGSDLYDFYSRNGYGAVVSAAINKYMYIVIHPYFHDQIRIKYSKTEDVATAEEVQHPIVRECLKKVKLTKGVEIASFADVSAGSGLGSSSAFTVCLLHALYAYKGESVSKKRLAEEACEIEINILGEPIGKQDQYSVAYGGINYFKFNKDETVDISPIELNVATQKKLRDSLCLYYVSGERRAGDILYEQKNNMANAEKLETLKKMIFLTDKLRQALINQDVSSLGRILHEGWLYKRELAQGISNSRIDALYDKFINAGASGGKLLGAGGGGFLLICSNNHNYLKETFKIKTLSFAINKGGTEIIFKE